MRVQSLGRRAALGGVLLVLIGGLGWASTAAAQEDDLEQQAIQIEESLNCPLCEGFTLHECPLLICDQMRAVIRQKLAAGASREEIVASFVALYGEEVVNAPLLGEGFNWSAWLLPFLALAGGAAWLAYVLRDWHRRRGAIAELESVSARPPEEYIRRAEEELGEID
ncbi:MAG: cytochrome c-type biogenesis protein CcmH [Chloroflexi bacterium]|nr:cytochrome c-type biogenesis protein CcmH [Chloroflexota bacterium]